MRWILESPTIVFSTAIVLGLIYPKLAEYVEFLVVPCLILAMLISTREMKFSLKDLRENLPTALKALLVNYGVLTMLIIASSRLLVSDTDYLKGFNVMAAIPPAVALIPFTYVLGGHALTSILGEIGCYVASIFLMPAIVYATTGGNVDVFYLIELTVILIFLPIAGSRLLTHVKSRLFDWGKSITNVSLALVSYTVVGLNQAAITTKPLQLLPVFAVMFLRTYVLATVIYFTLKRRGVEKSRTISYTLFGSYKNLGATAAIALVLFGSKAALPAAVGIIFEVSMLVYLSRILK